MAHSAGKHRGSLRSRSRERRYDNWPAEFARDDGSVRPHTDRTGIRFFATILTGLAFGWMRVQSGSAGTRRFMRAGLQFRALLDYDDLLAKRTYVDFFGALGWNRDRFELSRFFPGARLLAEVRCQRYRLRGSLHCESSAHPRISRQREFCFNSAQPWRSLGIVR
jgi:hypothetical protein